MILPGQGEPRSASRARERVLADGRRTRDEDWLAREEPLVLTIGGVRLGVVMRTPGDDQELGIGFALTEGLVKTSADIVRAHHDDADENVLVLVPHPRAVLDLTLARRALLATSSCGVCGRRTIDQVTAHCPTKLTPFPVAPALLARLPDLLRHSQPAFDLSGGHHAAGLVDRTGRSPLVREDIGRHNAVDKAVGAAVMQGLHLQELILVVSGRCSFEIVQKAAMVGVSVIVALGAASALAVDLARELGLTLCAFASQRGFSVYSGQEFVRA